MPRGAPLPENQPASGGYPLKALRLKLKEFKNRLLTTQTSDLSPLPDLAWREGDLNDLATLVHEPRLAQNRVHGSMPEGVTPRWPLGRNVN